MSPTEPHKDKKEKINQHNESHKDKKHNQPHHFFNKLFSIEEIDENMAKNEAAYKQKKCKNKVRRIIFFSIFCAIVLAVYIFAFIVDRLAPTPEKYPYLYPALVRFLRENILQNNGHPILQSVILISLGFIIITILEFIIKLFARGKNKRRKTIVILIAHAVRYIGVIIILVFLAEIWNIPSAITAAAIGALGIAIGFGAQGLIGDLITGLFLVFENSLQVGDILNFNGFRGEVEDIGFRTTKLRSISGEVKVINNSQLRVFINMTMHRSVARCDVNIEYGENISRVESIILEHLPKIAEKFPVISEGPIYKGVQEFNEKGVMLLIVAKCHETERLQLQRNLNREFKLLFDQHDIKLAVPKVGFMNYEHKE